MPRRRDMTKREQKIRDMRKTVRAMQHRQGMDDSTYRYILDAMFGVESTTQLSLKQLEGLRRHLVEMGTGKMPGARKEWIDIPKSDPHASQKRKILAMCKDLGWSFAYLNTRIKTQFGVEHIVFLHDQSALQILGKDMVSRLRQRGQDPYPY